MKTPLEDVGEYRKSKSDVSLMAETIDEDTQSTKVRCNPIWFELFKKGDDSGIMLVIDKGTQNVVKMEGGWGRAHKKHEIE